MKICCIVETVFQLINSLNLLLFDEEFKGAEIDLFVRRNSFTNCESYCERIRKQKVFHDINDFQFKDYSESNFVNHLKHFYQLFFAKRVIGKAIGNGYQFKSKEYDVLLTPNGCQFFKLAMLCCSKASIYCYEDGTLSYGGQNWISKEVSIFTKIILKVIGKAYKLNPERVYINKPEMFTASWKTEVIPLPSICASVRTENSIFKSIFGETDNVYKDNKVVYLTQPNPVPWTKTRNIIENIDGKFIVRYHPRIHGKLQVEKIHDFGNSQWELLCAEYITDNHILIGACSSAQTSPKWMFDKEPYLIFVYPLFGNEIGDEFVQVSKDIVKKTRALYRNPEKVIVATNVDDLNSIIRKVRGQDV